MNINHLSDIVRHRSNAISIYAPDLLYKYINIKALLVFDIDCHDLAKCLSHFYFLFLFLLVSLF